MRNSTACRVLIAYCTTLFGLEVLLKDAVIQSVRTVGISLICKLVCLKFNFI